MNENFSCLMVPTERPPTAVDIKRALLLFDNVKMFDPSDREIFHRSLWGSLGMPFMPVYVDTGPVMPLGKVPGHDDAFQDAIDECRDAVTERIVSIDAPAPNSEGGFTIGGLPVAQDRGAPAPIFQTVRHWSAEADLLRASLSSLRAAELTQEVAATLAPDGQAHAALASVTAAFDDGSVAPELALAARRLAVARLGSLVKAIACAEIRGLHLFTTDEGMNLVMSRIFASASASLADVLHDDEVRLVARAVRVERVLETFELPEARLSSMPIRDVLRSRTIAWGAAGEARRAFHKRVREISMESNTDQAFDTHVRREVEQYERGRADLDHEWKKLGLNASCETAAAAAILAGTDAVSQQMTMGWAATATMATLGMARVIGQNGKMVLDMWRKSRELETSVGRTLVRPFRL